MSDGNDALIFDREAALDRVDNDAELFGELISLFFEDYDQNIEAIETAISSQNAKQLMESAHSIKSALGNLGAMRAFHTAYAMEKMGREGSLEGASSHLAKMKQEVEAFKTESSDIA